MGKQKQRKHPEFDGELVVLIIGFIFFFINIELKPLGYTQTRSKAQLEGALIGASAAVCTYILSLLYKLFWKIKDYDDDRKKAKAEKTSPKKRKKKGKRNK